MKKYLFGLGAMLVGAGLMFVFTHTEVRADEEWIQTKCQMYKSKGSLYEYCIFKDLSCVSRRHGINCVKE